LFRYFGNIIFIVQYNSVSNLVTNFVYSCHTSDAEQEFIGFPCNRFFIKALINRLACDGKSAFVIGGFGGNTSKFLRKTTRIDFSNKTVRLPITYYWTLNVIVDDLSKKRKETNMTENYQTVGL